MAVTAKETRSLERNELGQATVYLLPYPPQLSALFFLYCKQGQHLILPRYSTLFLFYTRPRQLHGLKMDYDDDDYDQYRQYEDEMYKDPTDER